jgi:hypothetical protein
VPADVKILLQKFPSILCTEDVKPTPSITSTPQSPAASIQKNCKSPKLNLKGWNLPALFAVQLYHGHPLCTWFPKKMDRGGLVATIAV